MDKQTADTLNLIVEDNPGAMRVVNEVLGLGHLGGLLLASCYHINLTGSKLWVAYKDYALEDLNVFVQSLLDHRSVELREFVNAAVDKGWCGPNATKVISLEESQAIWDAKQAKP